MKGGMLRGYGEYLKVVVTANQKQDLIYGYYACVFC